VLEEPIPLLEEGASGHPQGGGQEHGVGLARHVGGAPALDLADKPCGHAGPLGELLDAPTPPAPRLPDRLSQHGGHCRESAARFQEEGELRQRTLSATLHTPKMANGRAVTDP
jgi:hypothetical protein